MAEMTEAQRRAALSSLVRSYRAPAWGGVAYDTTASGTSASPVPPARPGAASSTDHKRRREAESGENGRGAASGAGKSFADMTREELEREYRDRAVARDITGFGVPDTPAGWAGKGVLGVLSAFGVPTSLFSAAVQGTLAASDDDLGRAAYDRDPTIQDVLSDEDFAAFNAANAERQSDAQAAENDRQQNDAYGGPAPGSAGFGSESTVGNPENPADTQGFGDSFGDAHGSRGGTATIHQGGPVIGPNPWATGEEFTARVLEGEFMMDPQTTNYWGPDVLEAMQATAQGRASPTQAALLQKVFADMRSGRFALANTGMMR